MPDQTPEQVRDRALQLGISDPERLDRALTDFRTSSEGAGAFSSFLLEKGLVTVEQLQDLQPEADMGATMVDSGGGGIVGLSFSGCRIHRKLGQGGMGAVYLATRESDDKDVVVKFLNAEQAANPTWRARFLREAEVMRRIAHPNIVEIYSVDGEGDQPHIVMEFVDGEPLDERVAKGRVKAIEATQIAHDIARALAHAHAAGVVHRDIKPANVLYTHDKTVKVLDFGLAKNVESDDEGLSMPGQVLGTPHYMAPEQWGDHSVDARCDVFSLGAMLYHLVTGHLPFPGKSPVAISRKVLKGVFVPPSELVSGVPEDLELVIFRMMDRDRDFRYANAREVAEDFQRVLDRQQVEVPCLVELDGPNQGRRYPLLPGNSFALGRDETCEVMVSDRSVSRQHAKIERGKTGYVINDLGSTYGTYVGGMRVRNVVLKDKDEVGLGKVGLRFRDGGLGRAVQSTRRLAPDRMHVSTLPLPLVQALASEGDRRAVVALLEEMAPSSVTDHVALARQTLRMRLGGAVAESVSHILEKTLRRLRSRIPTQLFTISHENLGDDIERWLSWWDQTRATYPPQIAPQRPSVPTRLEVVGGEPEVRTIPLETHAVFEVGRELGKEVQLNSRSVSRHHATILRFHQRFAIRDEGSRFGTLVNGERVRVAFLRPGDRITMGKVELVFEVENPDPSATFADEEEMHVDAHTFDALVDGGHPSTFMGLLHFLEEAHAGFDWVEVEGKRLFPRNSEKQARFLASVNAAYARQAERAEQVLTKLIGKPEGGIGAWQALVHSKIPELPVQLIPQGWFPADHS